MDGFEACIDPERYYASLRALGYTTKRNGSAPKGSTFQGIRIQHLTVVRGPGLTPCLLVAWKKTRDPEMSYLSTRRFDTESQLNKWLERYSITLSRHPRSLR